MSLDHSPKTALILIERFVKLGKPGAFQYAFPVLHHQQRGPLGSHHNNQILPRHVDYLRQHQRYDRSDNLRVCLCLIELESLVDAWLLQQDDPRPISGMLYQKLCHEAVSRQSLAEDRD